MYMYKNVKTIDNDFYLVCHKAKFTCILRCFSTVFFLLFFFFLIFLFFAFFKMNEKLINFLFFFYLFLNLLSRCRLIFLIDVVDHCFR